MVSRKPTKPLSPPRPGAGDVAPTKPSPSPVARRVRGQAAREPAQVPRLRARRRIRLRRLQLLPPLLPPAPPLRRPPRRPRLPAQAPRRRRGAPAPPLLVPSSSAPSGGPRAVRRRAPPAGEADAVPGPRRDAHPRPHGLATARGVRLRRVFGGRSVTFYVAKRPGVDAFLRAAAERFEVVAFTAGLPEYASLVLDGLDPDGDLFAHRLYRGACRDVDGCSGRLVKDLAATGRALDSVLIVDDNPNSYALQPENAVPVAPFVGDDDNDRELQRVMAFLDVAAGFDDTREAIKHYKDLVRLAEPPAFF
ncbi:hypothetical protein EJB05_08796, partial [Eragrostis curvula]